MKNFDATRADGVSLCCAVCEREIVGGIWFARIWRRRQALAFCEPYCVELFVGQPGAGGQEAVWLQRLPKSGN